MWGAESQTVIFVLVLTTLFASGNPACLLVGLSPILYICKPSFMKSFGFLWPDGFLFHLPLRTNYIYMALKYLAFVHHLYFSFLSFLGSLRMPGCFLFLEIHVSSLVHLECFPPTYSHYICSLLNVSSQGIHFLYPVWVDVQNFLPWQKSSSQLD